MLPVNDEKKMKWVLSSKPGTSTCCTRVVEADWREKDKMKRWAFSFIAVGFIKSTIQTWDNSSVHQSNRPANPTSGHVKHQSEIAQDWAGLSTQHCYSEDELDNTVATEKWKQNKKIKYRSLRRFVWRHFPISEGARSGRQPTARRKILDRRWRLCWWRLPVGLWLYRMTRIPAKPVSVTSILTI